MIDSIIKHLVIIAIPIVKFIGKIKAPFRDHETVMGRYYEIENSLKPMDIILSVSYGEASNILNPSKWKHAIIYIGKENGVPMIVEAIGTGVTKRTLVQCMAEKDQIAIVRCKDGILSGDQIDKSIAWIYKQIGKKYDYEFNMEAGRGTQNFYCSELAYDAIKEGNGNAPFTLRKKYGMDTVTPSDFYDAVNKFDHILEIKK